MLDHHGALKARPLGENLSTPDSTGWQTMERYWRILAIR
jgi:hypothetical protein